MMVSLPKISVLQRRRPATDCPARSIAPQLLPSCCTPSTALLPCCSAAAHWPAGCGLMTLPGGWTGRGTWSRHATVTDKGREG
ncbi:hypothetical protein HaLaN_28308 [Haematococcus lacustris]|uniref:Uncharacterized protein n=1 Tax=Haematococcus lacustris TaxID=44745 RepID=A0A6A0AA25_HAELA|nr:hypothetical protein HaLaN_28308 [Haematococcus lacustris]